jgi:hypothetical protein
MTLSAIGAGLIVSNALLVAYSLAVLVREVRRDPFMLDD